MGERESNSTISHRQKALVAAGETTLFALGGLIWPPLCLGMIVTVPVTLLEGALTTNDFYRNLHRLEIDIDELGQRLDEHLRSDDDDEPIEPDPKTAIPEEIERHKKRVWDQATQPPRNK